MIKAGYSTMRNQEDKLIGNADKQLKAKKQRKQDKADENEIMFYVVNKVGRERAMDVVNNVRVRLEQKWHYSEKK